MWGAVFKMYDDWNRQGGLYDDEPEWPNEGACLRDMINRTGLRKIYDEPESPNDGGCSKSVMNRNRRMRGGGGCLRL